MKCFDISAVKSFFHPRLLCRWWVCCSLGWVWWPGRKVGFVFVESEAAAWSLCRTPPFLMGTSLREKTANSRNLFNLCVWAVYEGKKSTTTTKKPKHLSLRQETLMQPVMTFCQTDGCRGSWAAASSALRKVPSSVLPSLSSLKQLVRCYWLGIPCYPALDLFHSHTVVCCELCL